MIRVLQVITSLGAGGAERSSVELAVALRPLDVEVTFAVLVERHEGAGSEVEGLEVRAIPATSPLGRARAIRRLARDLDTDVVHSSIFEADIASRLARRPRTPLLCSLVNASYDPVRLEVDPNVRPGRLRAARLLDLATAPAVSRFHAITDTIAAEAVTRLHIPRKRITVVPRGRDRTRLGEPGAARRAATRSALGIGDVPVVLNVGRQEFQKGQVDLLRAWPQVLDRHPDAVLLVAGREGNASAALRAAVAEAGIDGSVRFLGHRRDVPDLLAAADVFAFPSRFEGLGGSVLEAMALDVPIVASDIPVLREVTAGAAELVVPGEPTLLGRGIVAVLDAEVPVATRVAAARQRFESTYSLAAAAAGMADLYRSVVRPPR